MRTQKRIDAQCSPHFLRLVAALVFVVVGASSHAGSNGARDTDTSRISVTAVAGDVDVTMAGKAAAVAPDAPVLLPARVVTGHDGSIGLTQAGTHINVANDTDVEIPAEAVDGNLIARLVQHRGNVFYDVAPRDLGKLRVETPLLVAVIKGTQFNVAVQEDSTTISLFEGRLEIRTPDGSDVVQLNAGEIAIRSRVDTSIRIVGMDDERVAAPAARPASAAAVAAADARLEVDDAVLTARVVLRDEGVRVTGPGAVAQASLKPVLDGAAVEGLVEVGGGALDVGLDADVGVGSGRIDVGLATGVDLGAGAVDLGLDAGVDLGAAAVDVGLDAGVDLGAGAVDLGLDAGVDLGAGAVDLGLDTSVDLGAATVDVGLDAGVDLGAGAVDLGLDTGVDLGAAAVDTGLDAGLDLGGALDVGLDAGADLGGVVDTSLDTGVTLDTGTGDVGLDAGLDLGTVVDVGLDVDLGSGGLDVDLDLGLNGGGAAPEPPSGGLGGLLGGLL
jgi:hypothetical protein